MTMSHPNLRYFRESMNLLISPCEVLWSILPPHDIMRKCYIQQLNKSYEDMLQEYRMFTVASLDAMEESEASAMIINKRKQFTKTLYNYKEQVGVITQKIHARRRYLDFLDLYNTDLQDSYHLNESFDGINSPYLPLDTRPLCLACENGSHESLFQCPHLTKYVPEKGVPQKILPEGVCKKCLMTDAQQSDRHACLREGNYICKKTMMHKLICQCPEHIRLHNHMLSNTHPPEGSLYLRVYLRKYFKNKNKMIGNHFWPL